MKKRHGAKQIVGLLRQADVALGKGQEVPEVCKQLGISKQTYFRDRQSGAPDFIALLGMQFTWGAAEEDKGGDEEKRQWRQGR
jgi:hypothetical protein